MSKQWEIKIVADTNDADYVTEVSKISDDELNKILPLIKAIKNFKPYTVKVRGTNWTHGHNFPDGEYSPRTDLGEKTINEIYSEFSEETIETFRDLVPTGEYGIHTIESIKIAPAKKWTTLL